MYLGIKQLWFILYSYFMVVTKLLMIYNLYKYTDLNV